MKTFLKNTSSIFFEKEFFTAILVGSLLIGVIFWVHIRKSVEDDINRRLDYKVEYIASALTDSLNTYALSLAYTGSYFDTNGLPTSVKFREFVERLQTHSMNHNLIGLNFTSRTKIEVLSRQMTQEQRLDIIKSLKKKSISLAYNLNHNVDLALVLPYFGQEKLAQGLIYIPVHIDEIFNDSLGWTNLEKENINFSLTYVGPHPNKEITIYSRFPDLEKEYALEKTKMINLYGRTWKLSVQPLPNFLSLSDRYISTAVAFASMLVLGILLSFFKQYKNTMTHKRKQKVLLEESNRMKTAFLANMSHEIRTPLNAITGYSEILSHADAQSTRLSLIENIKKNSTQLTSIIDNILDISNIEFGKLLITTHKVSLHNLFKEIFLNMNSRAETKGIDFKLSTVGALPEYIHTAESRVKQILINILGNAIKFTEAGSVAIQIKAEQDSSGFWYILISVTDTGIGISKRDQTELFKSFSQVDVSSTRRFGGVGLGLVVSKRMAKQIGGDVFLVESHLARGSTFQFKIQCGDLTGINWQVNLFNDILSQPKSTAYLTQKGQLEGKNILIVEDSEDNQDIFQFFLASAGAITEVVDNGISAVLKPREKHYDLILMDIQLPQMDGLEATRLLRSEGYTQPIIALTAHASPAEKMRSINAGCSGLITKPVSQDSLIQQILTISYDSNKNTSTHKVAIKDKENYDRHYANSH